MKRHCTYNDIALYYDRCWEWFSKLFNIYSENNSHLNIDNLRYIEDKFQIDVVYYSLEIVCFTAIIYSLFIWNITFIERRKLYEESNWQFEEWINGQLISKFTSSNQCETIQHDAEIQSCLLFQSNPRFAHLLRDEISMFLLSTSAKKRFIIFWSIGTYCKYHVITRLLFQ